MSFFFQLYVDCQLRQGCVNRTLSCGIMTRRAARVKNSSTADVTATQTDSVQDKNVKLTVRLMVWLQQTNIFSVFSVFKDC